MLGIGHPYRFSTICPGGSHIYGCKHQYDCHHCNHSPIFWPRWCNGIGAYRNIRLQMPTKLLRMLLTSTRNLGVLLLLPGSQSGALYFDLFFLSSFVMVN